MIVITILTVMQMRTVTIAAVTIVRIVILLATVVVVMLLAVKIVVVPLQLGVGPCLLSVEIISAVTVRLRQLDYNPIM